VSTTINTYALTIEDVRHELVTAGFPEHQTVSSSSRTGGSSSLRV
jgi:hypothetical protein